MKSFLSVCILFASTVFADAETLTFDGTLEPSKIAELSGQINGVVAELFIKDGQKVKKGELLIRLDDNDAKLELMEAEAVLKGATAELVLATSEAERTQSLSDRGITTQARSQLMNAALQRSKSEVDIAKAKRDRAALSVSRTEIRAPISGYVSKLNTSLGTFVEAKAGIPLGQIVKFDPIVVRYHVPYSTRLATLNQTGARSLEELFDRIELTVKLDHGLVYPFKGRPERASALIDADDGTLTVTSTLPNPNYTLRPGMKVKVEVNAQTPETD